MSDRSYSGRGFLSARLAQWSPTHQRNVLEEFRIAGGCEEIPRRLFVALARLGAASQIRIEYQEAGMRLHVKGREEEPSCVVPIRCSSSGTVTHLAIGPARVTLATRVLFAALYMGAAAIAALIATQQWGDKGPGAVALPLLGALTFPGIGYLVQKSAEARAFATAKELLADVLSREQDR